jgi:hypothetical protein
MGVRVLPRRGEFALASILCAVVVVAFIDLVGAEALKDYQTFMGAILALISAALAAFLLNKQIRQADRHEGDRRRSRREATRSVLPFALTAFIRYSIRSGTAVRTMIDAHNQNHALGANPTVPAIPTEAVSALKEMIELSDPDEAAVLAQIPALMQYQNSRLEGLVESLGPMPAPVPPGDAHNLITYALDAAQLHARVEALYDFARREQDRIIRTATYDRVRSALIFMGFNEIQHEQVFTALNHRARNNMQNLIRDIGA